MREIESQKAANFSEAETSRPQVEPENYLALLKIPSMLETGWV